MSFFGLGRAVTVDLTHAAGEAQRTAAVKSDRGNVEQLPVFTDKQTIAGHVHLSPAPGREDRPSRGEDRGFRPDRAVFRGDADDFVSLVRELVNPGEFAGPLSVPFEFKNVSLPHESYRGINVRVRYLLDCFTGGAATEALCRAKAAPSSCGYSTRRRR